MRLGYDEALPATVAEGVARAAVQDMRGSVEERDAGVLARRHAARRPWPFMGTSRPLRDGLQPVDRLVQQFAGLPQPRAYGSLGHAE